MEAQVLTKDGNEAINIFIKRTEDGVSLTVKAEPRVEEFFKKWGGGVRLTPEHGRLWRRPKNDTANPIHVWSYATRRSDYGDDGEQYTVDMAGKELVTEHGLVNLSFLRLVGVTEGTTINFDMVLSKQELVRISQRLLRAADMFYQEWIQVVGMRIRVSVEEER